MQTKWKFIEENHSKDDFKAIKEHHSCLTDAWWRVYLKQVYLTNDIRDNKSLETTHANESFKLTFSVGSFYRMVGIIQKHSVYLCNYKYIIIKIYVIDITNKNSSFSTTNLTHRNESLCPCITFVICCLPLPLLIRNTHPVKLFDY